MKKIFIMLVLIIGILFCFYISPLWWIYDFYEGYRDGCYDAQDHVDIGYLSKDIFNYFAAEPQEFWEHEFYRGGRGWNFWYSKGFHIGYKKITYSMGKEK